LLMEEASKYGGYQRIYWIRSHGQPTRGVLALELGGPNNPIIKTGSYEILHRASNLEGFFCGLLWTR
jgi:hypothetical protein